MLFFYHKMKRPAKGRDITPVPLIDPAQEHFAPRSSTWQWSQNQLAKQILSTPLAKNIHRDYLNGWNCFITFSSFGRAFLKSVVELWESISLVRNNFER